ncbi:zf-TFIIB domain-containing protein [Paracoccus marinaquae]|uniref:Zf-TFIIB domain-containing protein n=1 Tax=Paracoccus marinaquae TaxID=2841926 RepID=A0ABS6AF71_9RHOB|nr:zf-TFIIB domain-containing protein [Paracoccus marinaquae]MBU3029252.1 zf-TFIIB domain-containing protein [Paracoccus marinaquae]
MKCPVDNETLLMTSRNGVEIDYCPKCRGVWLDRGELDKIIEHSTAAAAPVPLAEPARETRPEPRREERRYRDDDRRYDDDDDYRHGRRHKKRESFLSDLFDF